jgi:hypothetical protein
LKAKAMSLIGTDPGTAPQAMTPNDETPPIVFFSRCRPQDADPIDIVVRERRVFIGWPAWRTGVEPRRGCLREAIVDFWCPDAEWAKLYAGFGRERRHYQQNRNFARTITPGALALVPRPGLGVVYAGRVISGFEVLDDPPWADEYLKIRRGQGLDADDEFSHLGDVAQCCMVDHFRALPFPLIPAWIRRSLLGRSTYGRVGPLPEFGLDPYDRLDTLLDCPGHAVRGWTSDLAEVERRLIDAVGPNSLEHLCVALLQLECPEDVWMHVGGSGDGGVDGIGADQCGTAVGILQTKWAYWGGNLFTDVTGTRRILAALLHPRNVQVQNGVEFWSRSHIASLVIKHAARLPLAVSLRIGVAA